MEFQDVTDDLITLCRTVLGTALTGVYLHGSMAMGCFHAGQSDLDLLAVTETSLSDSQKRRLMEGIVGLNGRGPAKGLEISFLKREFCLPFVYPTPFELHFSPMHLPWFQRDPEDYIRRMNGTDRDLAAHVMILNHFGLALYGREIAGVFGQVPREAYLDSIWHDIQTAREDVLREPVYVILNLCRVSAYLSEGLVLSKEAGGRWGLSHLPQAYAPVIFQALSRYGSQTPVPIDMETAQIFADAMLREISACL
jgi:hypothetical protein